MNTKVKVKVPNRSGFDKSHQNILTTKCGTLTPILCDELIPNSHVNLEMAISASLPPLATDTFMRCDLKVEAFFVPTRILYGGYEDWLVGNQIYVPGETDYDVFLPTLLVDNSENDISEYTNPGTLFDYLGGKMKTHVDGSTPNLGKVNIFPFLSYHKIYDDWYRNTQVQSPVFIRGNVNTMPGDVSNLPYTWYTEDDATNYHFSLGSVFNDGVALGELRQRNFGMDYFTISSPNPQLGDAQKVTIPISSNHGTMTIASLRAANSLQVFSERNNLAGKRMQDYVKNQFGADLSSGVAQRSIYLGSTSFEVYSKGVYQTVGNPDAATQTQNPFDVVGAEYGDASASGTGTLVKDFTAEEPGYLMVLASLVPRVTYSTGFNRLLWRYTTSNITDMANPLLQNVGNQPIYSWELNGLNYFNDGLNGRVFGYTDRYADFKYMPDELHGLVRDGESLDSFALQRTCTGTPTISSEFLKIPTTYLDQVAAVDGDISSYGVWMDSFFKYHVSMPLAEYAIPSLQDPAYEHGHDVEVDIRGSRL